MIRHTLTVLNTVELNYTFMMSLDKCSRSCNFADDLSPEICI